jgi:hypothetical protein
VLASDLQNRLRQGMTCESSILYNSAVSYYDYIASKVDDENEYGVLVE